MTPPIYIFICKQLVVLWNFGSQFSSAINLKFQLEMFLWNNIHFPTWNNELNTFLAGLSCRFIFKTETSCKIYSSLVFINTKFNWTDSNLVQGFQGHCLLQLTSKSYINTVLTLSSFYQAEH